MASHLIYNLTYAECFCHLKLPSLYYRRRGDRGVARSGVMVGPLCDHYFAATWMKAIFHAIRQYSQNKIIHIILFKLKCIVTY